MMKQLPRVGDLVEVTAEPMQIRCKGRVTRVDNADSFWVEGRNPMDKPYSIRFQVDGYSTLGLFFISQHWPDNNLEDQKRAP